MEKGLCHTRARRASALANRSSSSTELRSDRQEGPEAARRRDAEAAVPAVTVEGGGAPALGSGSSATGALGSALVHTAQLRASAKERTEDGGRERERQQWTEHYEEDGAQHREPIPTGDPRSVEARVRDRGAAMCWTLLATVW